MAENGGGRQKIFRPRPKIPKSISKKIQSADQVLGLCSHVKVQKRPKIGDFKPFLENIFCKSVPGEWEVTVIGAGGMKPGPDTSPLSPKKIWGPNSKITIFNEKKKRPPPPEKGGFRGGNEISPFRQL